MASRTTTDMKTYVAEAFGSFGVDSVQIGSTVIQTIRPDELEQLEGYGDTIRRGDVISYLHNGVKAYPAIVVAIQRPLHEGCGPGLLTRRVDDGPHQKRHMGPTSFFSSGVDWRHSFKRLTQADLNHWFEETKKALPDGWHRHPDYLASIEFRTLAGVPVEVKCGYATYQHTAEEVGRITGYDVKLAGRFSDKKTRTMSVTKAERRQPPQVR